MEYAVAASGGLLFILCVIVIIICVVHRKRRARVQRTMSLHKVKAVHREQHPKNQILSNTTQVLGDGGENPKITSLNSLVTTLGIIVFGRDNLHFDRNLGEGAFGKVNKKSKNSVKNNISPELFLILLKDTLQRFPTRNVILPKIFFFLYLSLLYTGSKMQNAKYST